MRLLLIAIVVMFSFEVTAQTENKLVEKQVTDVISLLKRQSFEVKFTLVYSNATKNVNDIQYGTCLVMGNKFHLSMSGIDTYFDGKTQWVYMAADNEVTISEPTEEELKEISPIAMVEYYSKQHRKEKDIQRRANDNVYINLFPKDLKVEHFKISMVISKENKLKQITIFQKNGDKIEFHWDDIIVKNIDNSSFVFVASKFPNVFINDMR